MHCVVILYCSFLAVGTGKVVDVLRVAVKEHKQYEYTRAHTYTPTHQDKSVIVSSDI